VAPLSQFHAAESQLLQCSPGEFVSVLWMIEQMAQPVEEVVAEPGWPALLALEKAGSWFLQVAEKPGLDSPPLVWWVLPPGACCTR
jgi:hypothetical protein